VTKISAVVPDNIVAVLKERARAEDRSLGAVIRLALADHIRRLDPAELSAVPTTPADGKDR
jgi:Ribbon-helix-helix protein, copG family